MEGSVIFKKFSLSLYYMHLITTLQPPIQKGKEDSDKDLQNLPARTPSRQLAV